MGVASKFLMLLSTPFPLLYPSRYAVRLARYSRLALAASLPTDPPPPCSCFYGPLPVSPRRQRSSFSLRAAMEFHTGTTDRVDYEQLPQTAKTAKEWPEWSRFVEHVTASEYGNMRSFLSAAATSEGDDDSFVPSCDLPEGFAKVAEACLGFARERPVLLKLLSKKNVKVIVDNVTPFLFKNGLNSSRRMALYSSTEGFSLSETIPAQTVDLMRYLLSYAYSQLISSKVGSFSATKFLETSINDLLNDIINTSNPVQVSSHVNSSASSSEQTQDIEKRRGDWICPECSHLNFARKIKCWKCDKRRPKRLPLIGEDWECPQCSYLNFARNIKCLKCEGSPKRPATGAEWDCPQCDFFNSGRNLACLRCDCKRPMTASDESDRDYMRVRSFDHIQSQESDKDRNAEIGSDKMSESSHSSVLSSVGADEDFSRIMTRKWSNGLAHTTKDSGPPAEGSGRLSVNISDKCLDSSITRSLETILGQSSPASGNAHASGKNDNDSTAFVPVPSNMIRDHQSPSLQEKRLGNRVSSPEGDLRNVPSKKFQGGGSVPHHESSNNFDNDKDSFNLSKNTSGLYDKNQTASVSNNDFPEIMPMRKGENRFVVSRKKDRSLTSPQYKKRLAMEQAGGSNFVPFVPFPPGYFARKDEPGGDETRKNQPTDTHSAANVHSYWSKNKQSSGNEYSSRNNSNNTHTDEKVANQSVKGSSGGFTGQSLEGSAVPEEPDPLDMSEEAKAQRWFRRVAQITDISELSKIPDEDFPEIMPMRKGVNRFVVSKRKTPLERRLTSPQYRRNLPTVSSDPKKDQ